MARKLTNIRVNFISLVSKGANKKTVLWKGELPEGGEKLTKEIKNLKEDTEKRMVYGIVYAPDEVDTDKDYAEATEIEKAAHAFMLDGRAGWSVDKQHDYNGSYGYVAESWIVKEQDPFFKEQGAWAVGIKVTDDETWEEIKKGEITGLSIAGTAEFERGEKPDIEKEAVSFLSKLFKAFKREKPETEEEDMTKEEVQAIVKEAMAAEIAEIEKGVEDKLVKVTETLTAKIDEGFEEFQKAQDNTTEEVEQTSKEVEEKTDKKLEKSEERMAKLETAVTKMADYYETIANAVISKADTTEKSAPKEKSIFDNVVNV